MQAKTDATSPVLTREQLQKLIRDKLKRAKQQSEQLKHFKRLERA